MTTMTTHARPTRRRAIQIASVLAAAALGLAFATTSTSQQANAAGTTMPAASPTDGWMRVAHLSPDTKAVDVTLTAAKGGQTVVELDDIAYGTVSQYIHIPAGDYVVAMTPWSSGPHTAALISASVNIVQGKSITVAAFGKYKHLQTRVFQDDLASPTSNNARIRLIQASTVSKSVNVKTSSGIIVATDATAGEATSYATVPAGTWTLDVSSKHLSDSSPVQLKQGSVNTLFVLDNSTGGLAVKSVLDSASVGQDPIGGINTGGGWESTHDAFGLLGDNQ
jgi:hypothetical protein